MSGSRRPRLVACAALGLAVAGSLAPVYLLVVESLKSAGEDLVGNPLIVRHPTLQWYLGLVEPATWLRGEIFVRKVPFLTWLLNTGIVLPAAVAVTLAISLAAAYALARLRPPGWIMWRRWLLALSVIPQPVLLLPAYHLALELHLDDSLPVLALIYPVLATPACVWLLSAYFQRVDPRLEESASLDGAGRLTAFVYIVLPMSWPVVIAAAVFASTAIGGDIMFASIFLSGETHQTLAAGLGAMDASMVNLSLVAGVTAAALPLAVAGSAAAGIVVRGITTAFSGGGGLADQSVARL